jgi:hypothetical protein
MASFHRTQKKNACCAGFMFINYFPIVLKHFLIYVTLLALHFIKLTPACTGLLASFVISYNFD